MPTEHIAIINRASAAALLSGRKRIESRFSRTRRAPLGRVRVGDRIHFKLSGGPVIGEARVQRVREFHDLDAPRMRWLQRRYNADVRAPASYWRARRSSRFAVLIWLSGLTRGGAGATAPRQYGTAWIVLGPGGASHLTSTA